MTDDQAPITLRRAAVSFALSLMFFLAITVCLVLLIL